MHLIYTPVALEDFRRILDRISIDNPPAAVRLGEDILRTCELLKSHPQMGERVENLSPGLRRFSCRGYGIYYRIEEDRQAIYVGRFLHPKLDVVPELFED